MPWAFERALGRTRQPQGQDALSNVERALRLYHGPFLRLGRTAEARATDERCRRVLAATLGAPPSAETLALFRTLGL